MTFFSAENQYIYDIISEYYDNPILYKIRDDSYTSLFGIQLHSQFLNERYYIICSAPYEKQDQINLKFLPWTTFQVRTSTTEKYSHLPKIIFTPKKEEKFLIPLSIQSRNSEISIYECKSFPNIVVNLLHCKGIEYEYSNKGTLKNALDTKQTIIQFRD